MAKAKIVIIDDEKGMVKLLYDELTDAGYDVYSACDGDSGLKLIKDRGADIVLLDVMMFGLNGYQVLEQLKTGQTTKHIPVIMLTAKGLEEDIQKGLDLGADDYITKPFHPGLLVRRIEKELR